MTDIKTSVLYVSGKPNMVTLDYSILTGDENKWVLSEAVLLIAEFWFEFFAASSVSPTIHIVSKSSRPSWEKFLVLRATSRSMETSRPLTTLLTLIQLSIFTLWRSLTRTAKTICCFRRRVCCLCRRIRQRKVYFISREEVNEIKDNFKEM